jgi:aspartyl-tRNA synthetase
LGGLTFLTLRDREGSVQVTAKKGREPEEIFRMIAGITRESCVRVTGNVHEAKSAPGGIEIIPVKVELVTKAETPLPMDIVGKIETNIDTRFDYRYLDIRNPKTTAVFRIKSEVLYATRECFRKWGFIDVQTAVIQAAGAEGGSTLFPVIYYQKEAFLRQSPQLYKQMLMASGLDRVCEIGPVFRAEKFHTTRHVSEFTSIDGEMAWIESEEDNLKFLENLMHDVMKHIKQACAKELKLLGQEIIVPKLPFPRLNYEECLKILNEHGENLKFGDDMADVQEKKLGEIMAKKGHEWYFITKFPSESKPFYIMYDGKVSRGYDMDWKGLEMCSGGQREHRFEKLKDNLRSKGLDPEKFTFYTDAFRYGIAPHGGFGIGLDRLVQKICGLDNVKEAIMFPRTPERMAP